MWLREADTKSSEILELHVHGDGVKRGTKTLGYAYTTLWTWKTCDTEIKNACDHCLSGLDVKWFCACSHVEPTSGKT